MDDAHFGESPGKFAEDAGSSVFAVVDDNDLEVGRQPARRENGGDDHARDGPAVVVRRKEDGPGAEARVAMSKTPDLSTPPTCRARREAVARAR